MIQLKQIAQIAMAMILSLPLLAQAPTAGPSANKRPYKSLPSTLENWPEIERRALEDGYEDHYSSVNILSKGEMILLKGETDVEVVDADVRQFVRVTSSIRVNWMGFGIRGMNAKVTAPKDLKEIRVPKGYGRLLLVRLVPGKFAYYEERQILIPQRMPARHVINLLQGGGVEQETYNDALGLKPDFKKDYEYHGGIITLPSQLSPGHYAVIELTEDKFWDFDVQ